MAANTKTTVYLTNELRRGLRAKSRRLGCSEASLIRKALESELKEDEVILPSSVGCFASDDHESGVDVKRRLRQQWIDELRRNA